MNYDLLSDFYNSENLRNLIAKIKETRKDKSPLLISKLIGSSDSLTIKKIFEFEDQVLFAVEKLQHVNELKVELSLLGLSEFIIDINDLTKEKIQEKLTIVNNKDKFILIATYDFLIHKLPAKDEIQKNTTTVEVGTELTYDDLIEYLHISNYSKDKFVESPGDFSIRGAIIDFWSYSESQPCRLEFDGDFLESIRYFDPESQRSSSRVEKVTVASQVEAASEVKSSSLIFDYLDDPIVIASSLQLDELFKPKQEQEISEEADDIDDDLREEIFDGKQEDDEKMDAEKETSDEITKEHLLKSNCKWILQKELGGDEERQNLGLYDTPPVNSNFKVLASIIKKYSDDDFNIVITAENELQVKRLTGLLSEFDKEVATLIETKSVVVIDLPIRKGFVLKNEKLIVLTDYEIFNKPYRTKLSSKQKYKKSKARDLASLKIGNFVVHENFGIGKYAGLETINIGLTQQESIKILYAEGDVVYVNLNYLALVKKFSSNEEMTPRLTNLKNNEWKLTKKKVKSKIKDAARQLIQLYAKRKSALGHQFAPDTIWQRELEASFMYEDTADQAKVTEELKVDMESENPMDRLVCGDVGFGKTEVAVRAAFKAVNDNKQVALLVPTTILAEQHYNTFKDRLAQFPVKVEALSRFSTKKQQDETVMRLNNGQTDIVIGTHRLLSKDIQFKDLGLLIVDEEHRFGVMHKEKLRNLRANVDTLTLTATPIPRTLNMSLLGARDLSIIATPPPNRIPIVTKVEKFDIVKIRQWVMQEINREGQVYLVHDRVQSIDKIAAYIQRHIPGIKIAVAHGQMKPSQLEKVIHEFLEKKFHMLIATKIIESGLDIPNVNTIIINQSRSFRSGRITSITRTSGTFGQTSFCLFTCSITQHDYKKSGSPTCRD
jgi:transcription-repair coupling factor (superfamily II helicase)